MYTHEKEVTVTERERESEREMLYVCNKRSRELHRASRELPHTVRTNCDTQPTAKYTDEIKFTITFQCKMKPVEDLVWKIVWVSSAKDEGLDQVLDEVDVPPDVGINKVYQCMCVWSVCVCLRLSLSSVCQSVSACFYLFFSCVCVVCACVCVSVCVSLPVFHSLTSTNSRAALRTQFDFVVDPPNPSRIPASDMLGVTVVMVQVCACVCVCVCT
jgi:hypothetical protein